MDFLTVERDPNKRRVKPVEQACVLDFDEESSDDSDFRIEDHPDASDDEYSLDSNPEGNEIESSGEEEEESEGSDLDELKNLNLSNTNGIYSIADVIHQATIQSKLRFEEKDAQILICCGCLGDQSDGINEIVECDGCGVTVHEACYGVSDSASLASTDSLSPTTPWFCEACKAGVKEPICELCPNSGGIFKETDVGKWVHLVCALYVPGVAFGEVDKLTSVTLFEMPYSKWGAKNCCLCEDDRFARTGVCIGCDAGMCRTYFHVTCAQREGFLSEAHSEEVDQADPFYAHCKLHSDKTLVKKRKKNYLALQLRTHYRKCQFEQEGHKDTPEQVRIQRKLEKQKVHYLSHKALKPPPWACRKLLRKAELMGINTLALEMQEAQAAALVDVRKKWHIPPAFTVEFIAYFLDRNDRLKEMKTTLEKFMEDNKNLLDEQQSLRVKYDEVLKKNTDVTSKNIDLKQHIHKYHSAILSACPTKNLPNIDDLGKPPVTRAPQPMMVPTAAALKMGVVASRKKSKLYGWQCSECDKTSDSEVEEVKTPRRSRSRYSRENKSDQEISSPPKLKIKPLGPHETKSNPTSPLLHVRKHSLSFKSPSSNLNTSHDTHIQDTSLNSTTESNGVQIILDNGIEGHKSAKKRRREKHRNRYSPDLGISSREHKRKRKKKSLDIEDCLPHPRITIKVASESNPQCFYVPNEADDNAPPPLPPKIAKIEKREMRKSRSPRVSDAGKMLVICDECQKNYHFTCLDPPVKKTPKRRGYSWHCADCDPTGSE
ncbi:hypothetical protein NQ314_019898 [Rhamnusium bicolor]|uniref:PHD finger protein 14 n=1 Tax=Rhamnusium bicolor TaxID=1586634 RepID=A0AAV8WN76_9CUCU|nr:hypothetical protein NQ314_019898 [Rhamnusium bicolor]